MIGLGVSLWRIALLGGESGPRIKLSDRSVAEDAEVNDVVGVLSVAGGSGSYTFTLTDDAGGLFDLDGADLIVADALSVGTESITVQADNGVDAPISRAFSITVTSLGSFELREDGGFELREDGGMELREAA